MFSLYLRDAGFGKENIDSGWLGRQGIALALHSVADVLRTKDLPVVMTFLISRALVLMLHSSLFRAMLVQTLFALNLLTLAFFP